MKNVSKAEETGVPKMKQSMKLSEILQSSMVNDNTVICIAKPIGDTGMEFRRKGFWYTDDIVGMSDCEVTKLTYIRDKNRIYMDVEDAEEC